MYVFIFVSTFMINFALYQAGPQNYANQGFEENGPPSQQINYSASKNGNKNRHARESLYTKYYDGEKEVLSVGNGNNKKNVFYIGENPSDNTGFSINKDTNFARIPNNFNPSPANNYPEPQEKPNLGNRFGSNEPRRETTRINNIGNGMANSNTFFINDLDGGGSSVKVFSTSNNNNQRPNIRQQDYYPNTENVNTNIQRNFNEGTTFKNNRFDRGPNGQPLQPDLKPNINNYANTNEQRRFNDGSTDTYNVFGHGQNNKNLVITNGYRVQDSGPNIDNYGNINTQRNFNEGTTFKNNRFDRGPNGQPIQPDLKPNINNYANTNEQRRFNDGSTDTYNVFGHGQNNKNLVITNGNRVQDFGPNIDNYGNINTQRNFDEGYHAVSTNTYTYNEIGNGESNNNRIVINGKPVLPDSRTSVNYNNNVNSQRLFNQRPNFNNKGTTNTHTYTRIGYGPNNKNVVIVDGETIYHSDSGVSLTNRERSGQGDSTPCSLSSTCPKPFMAFGAIKQKFEKGLHYLNELVNKFFKCLS